MDNLANNPQAPHYALTPQYGPSPQGGQYPRYGAGRPMPVKKKSVWPKVLMIGCGCLAGMALVALVFLLLLFQQCEEHSKDRTTPLIKELNITENLVQKNHLDSLQIKELIYIGMPKDSVLIALGKPDSYLDANWGDYVCYDLNDSTNVQINFHNEVVEDINFEESVPSRFLKEEVTDSI